MKHVAPVVTGTSVISTAGSRDFIDSCDLAAVSGSELTLRFSYRLDNARRQPIFAGAWLYDGSGKSIDAGYRPVAITSFPEGWVDLVLVLPGKSFTSAYVETFLMESGQAPFVQSRFKMGYTWKDGVLSKSQVAGGSAADGGRKKLIEEHAAFCQDYADTAVAQYTRATGQKLQGIRPPVWSADFDHHYSWCLRVPEGQARAGTAMRREYLEKYQRIDGDGGQERRIPDRPELQVIKPAEKAPVFHGAGEKK